MKNRIARLGIIGFVSLFTFPCFAFPCFAMSVSDLLISETMANPAENSDTRGEWLERFNPTIEPINLRGIDLGDDGSNRQRFDTDLLILPSEFLTLASHSYGSGDIGTPGAVGSMLFALSAVPVPGTAGLFVSGLFAVFSPNTAKSVASHGSIASLHRIAAKVGPSQWSAVSNSRFAVEGLKS